MKAAFIQFAAVAAFISTASANPGAVRFDFHGVRNVPHHNILPPFPPIPKSSNAHIRHGHDKVKSGNISWTTSAGVPSQTGSYNQSISNDVNLTTGYNYYLTNITIGSPPQLIEVGLDTGSPYLWAFGPNALYNDAPRFSPQDSVTFESLNKSFSAFYGAGGVLGEWGKDNVRINGAEVRQFPFGVISQFNFSSGVPGLLGVGPGPNLTNETYSNVPEALYKNGVTKSAAFSVFLESDSNGGAVIFGGADKAKYEDPVYNYDIVKSGSQRTYYYQLALSSLAHNGGDPYDVFGIAVLDTGSPVSQLPPGFVNQMGQNLGFAYYDKYQTWYKAENDTIAINYNGSISMTFGKFTAEIPINDLIVPGEYVWSQDGPSGVQALGLIGGSSYVIGDHFFKNAYVTFDSLAKKIYLAKGVAGSTTPDIIDLDETGFPGAIPGANSAASGPYQSFTYTTLTPRPPATTQNQNNTSISVVATTPVISSLTTSVPLFYTA